MALPNSNISVSMVKAAIGSGSNDVGTLCTHPNINMLSIRKPIRFDKVTPLLPSEYKGKNTQDWYDGIETYGIRKGFTKFSFGHPFYNTSGPPVYLQGSHFSGLQSNWVYSKPRGGVNNEYFRLGDFREYEHEKKIYPIVNRQFPVYGWGDAVYINEGIYFTALLRFYAEDFEGTLGLQSLMDMQHSSSAPKDGLYIGLCAESTNRNGFNIAPLTACWYGSSKLGNIDPNTGFDYMLYTQSGVLPVDNTPITSISADPSKFHIGETIRITPFLYGYSSDTDSGGRPYVICFSFRNSYADVLPGIYTIPSSAMPSNTVEVTNFSFTVTRGNAPEGFSSEYNAFYLNTLSITVAKPAAAGVNIEFVGQISLTPIGEIGIGAIADGNLGTVELSPTGTSQVLNQSIIIDRGSVPPFKPWLVAKTTGSVQLTAMFQYKKFGTTSTVVSATITVPPL